MESLAGVWLTEAGRWLPEAIRGLPERAVREAGAGEPVRRLAESLGLGVAEASASYSRNPWPLTLATLFQTSFFPC